MSIDANNIRDLPKPSFINWMAKEESISLHGVDTACYRLDYEVDEAALDEWALHLRRHYVRDDELAAESHGIGRTPSEYLKEFIIPTEKRMRTSDFAEILVSDMLQFVEGYESPRYKHHGRTASNASERGVDVIAYPAFDPEEPKASDELILVEVKSGAASSLREVLNRVGADCGKDEARRAMTLNYIRQRSLRSKDDRTSSEMARFLMKGDHSYKSTFAGAATVGVRNLEGKLDNMTAEEFGVQGYDRLFIIHADKLMDLIENVYGRCTQ